jgi:hypothetical protein
MFHHGVGNDFGGAWYDLPTGGQRRVVAPPINGTAG